MSRRTTAGPAPLIGRHLATLNLFREPDGTFEITVAAAHGAIAEWNAHQAAGADAGKHPLEYTEGLIIAAAMRMLARHAKLPAEADPLAIVLEALALPKGARL